MNSFNEKGLIWLGNAKDNLMKFPHEVVKDVGYALHFAQNGAKHPSAKPLKGFDIGGVFEIVENFLSDTYRAVYAVKLGNKIYVLHCFQKKSTQGIKTPQKEINIIKSRLKIAQEIENVKK